MRRSSRTEQRNARKPAPSGGGIPRHLTLAAALRERHHVRRLPLHGGASLRPISLCALSHSIPVVCASTATQSHCRPGLHLPSGLRRPACLPTLPCNEKLRLLSLHRGAVWLAQLSPMPRAAHSGQPIHASFLAEVPAAGGESSNAQTGRVRTGHEKQGSPAHLAAAVTAPLNCSSKLCAAAAMRSPGGDAQRGRGCARNRLLPTRRRCMHCTPAARVPPPLPAGLTTRGPAARHRASCRQHCGRRRTLPFSLAACLHGRPGGRQQAGLHACAHPRGSRS